MHIALARAYVKKLDGLLLELEDARSQAERVPLILRMHDIVQPLYIVNSKAAQHIEESLRKLKYGENAVVNAAIATMHRAISDFFLSIKSHGSNNFLIRGPQRTFVRPVAELELRSLVEKNFLFDHEHSPFVHAIGIKPHIEETLLHAPPSDLKPVLARMGFPHNDALVFFKTDAVPTLGVPSENMPSLMLYKFRSGSPLRVLKHRVLH